MSWGKIAKGPRLAMCTSVHGIQSVRSAQSEQNRNNRNQLAIWQPVAGNWNGMGERVCHGIAALGFTTL